jgi:hypothetical protein
MKHSCGLLLAVAALLVAGCATTPEREANRATGAVIAAATTPEARATLERVRDEANAEMREEAEALDREIERLREENAALEGQLENR